MRWARIVSLALGTPDGPAVCVSGRPGRGKTAILGQIASRLGIEPWETVIASLREPSDFAGLPIPGEGGVDLAAPSWARRIERAGKGGVFLDEVDKGAPAVQSALLRPVLEGVVGDLALPRGVKWVLAMNPSQSGGQWDLLEPLANRCLHVKADAPDPAQWARWLMGVDDGLGDLPVVDPAKYQDEYQTASAHVAAFIERARPALLEEDEKAYAGRFPLAYATGRSWASVRKLYAACRATHEDDLLIDCVSGLVGDGVATEFCSWLRDADLPDPETLLADPLKWEPDAKRLDKTFAVLCSVSAAGIRPQKDKGLFVKRWTAAWRVLARAMELGKDLVVVSADQLVTNRPQGALLDKDVIDIVSRIKPINDLVRQVKT